MTDAAIYQQAAAFESWARRGGSGDLGQDFNAWAESKDFEPGDRDRIWLAIHGVLQERRLAS